MLNPFGRGRCVKRQSSKKDINFSASSKKDVSRVKTMFPPRKECDIPFGWCDIFLPGVTS